MYYRLFHDIPAVPTMPGSLGEPHLTTQTTPQVWLRERMAVHPLHYSLVNSLGLSSFQLPRFPLRAED
jgi:hypothetical protein